MNEDKWVKHVWRHGQEESFDFDSLTSCLRSIEALDDEEVVRYVYGPGDVCLQGDQLDEAVTSQYLYDAERNEF